MDESVDCTYADCTGAGIAGLTWAQQFMREVVLATGAPVADFDLLLVYDLPHPLPVGAAEDLIRRFLARNPLLRTSISETADGTMIQRVNAAGAISIPVHTTGDPLSADLRSLVPGATFDTPFRCLFIAQGTSVLRIAMRVSHIMTDASGGKLLSDDLAVLATGSAVGPAPPTSLDLARFEAAEEGQRIQRRSLDHAAAVYEVSAPTMWSGRRDPQSPRFRAGQMRSTDLLAALAVLTSELRMTRAGALAAALGAVMAFRAGLESALLFLISGNRFDPDWASYPGLLSQETILHLPVGPTVRETMRTATTESIRSLRKARYSPAELDKLRRAAEDRRGVSFDKLGNAVVLNLIPTDVEPGEFRPAPTTFAWTGATDAENLGCYVDASQTSKDFRLGMRIDTALVAPREMEVLLRTMEWMIVSVASHDMTISELHTHLKSVFAAG